MPQTTPMGGKLMRLYVSTVEAGPYTLVKGMNAYDKTSNRQVESTDTFDASNAFSEPGAREVGYTVNGLLIPDDPGQDIVRDAEAVDATFWVKVTPMGGSSDTTQNGRGWTHAVKVSNTRHGAQTRGAQTWGFDLVSQADPVATAAAAPLEAGYII